MEDNRVLNFSEFGKKYSQDASNDAAASYSEFATASDKFTTAFDEESYNQDQLGPQKPIDGGGESTPAQPGEDNAPAFSATADDSGMAAPSDEEGSNGSATGSDGGGPDMPSSSGGSSNDFEEEATDNFEGEDEDAEEVEFEEGEEGEDEDFEEDFDDEDGGDPEEEEDEDEDEEEDEEANESFKSLITHGLVESFEDYSKGRSVLNAQPQQRSGGYDDVINNIELEISDEDDCMVKCRSCGSTKQIAQGEFPFGQANVDNPDSWWQGSDIGMQCESCK